MAEFAARRSPAAPRRIARLLEHLAVGRPGASVPSASEPAKYCGVDFARYPLDRPESAEYRALVSRAAAQLKETGCATFPGLLTPEATARAAADAVRKAPSAFVTDAEHNAYQLPGTDDALPADHVRNVPMRTRVASTAYCELDPDGVLRRLYGFDGLLRLVSDVTGKTLYRLADPLGACTINVFRPSWYHAWHFDEAEYTTTLCLQQPEAGGEFEFTSPLRASQEDLAADAVSRVLRRHSGYSAWADGGERSGGDGDECPRVSTASFEPGTLQIFAGRYSLHQVRTVSPSATRDRLVAVLCFATEPGVVNSPEVQKMFWGRTA